MRKLLLGLIPLVLTTCSKKEEVKNENSLLQDWTTPYQIPPFDKIKNADFAPAVEEGFRRHDAAIDSIAKNPAAPTFENTIEAMEGSAKLLDIISSTFFNLVAANTNDSLQKLSPVIEPEYSAHYDRINLRQDLFARVKTLFDQKATLNLTPEQDKILTSDYKDFIRAGINLNEEQKKRMLAINKRLAILSVQFSQHVLSEEKKFELVLDSTDLAGLPTSVRKAGQEAANARNHKGKYVYTIHKPSLFPFITYSTRRDLRMEIKKAYITKGDHGDSLDNKEVLREMANLRLERANLLGYSTHADYILEKNMLNTPKQVYELLNKVWAPSIAKAKEERDNILKLAKKDDPKIVVGPWDWWYYTEKIKARDYNLDENELRPYFKADNVIKGTFILANKLFHITFKERMDLPKYHPEVHTYEVMNEKGEVIGIYLSDWFYRDNKRGGAWCNTYRDESHIKGNKVLPIVVNVGNFTKPTSDTPSLLSLEETRTLFHEFGHALRSLLSDFTYPSGNWVPRDFVEFPSQVLENWVEQPEMLSLYAFHYKTGEVIPKSLVDKINNANKFNNGFIYTELLAAMKLDMDYHTITQPITGDINAFEKRSMDELGLIDAIAPRYRSTYFQHIFAGGYSSGYYGYLNSQVLDADAFEAFHEKGLFDQGLAKLYRDQIFNGAESPMDIYVKFRGHKPEIGPMLKRAGLK